MKTIRWLLTNESTGQDPMETLLNYSSCHWIVLYEIVYFFGHKIYLLVIDDLSKEIVVL